MSDIDYDQLADMITERLIIKLKKEHDHARSFAWARKNLFMGKSYSWIKYWIIGKYPEILVKNGGWLTEPAGSGHPVKVVSEKQARKWLDDNRQKIDWNSPEPITLARRNGLAKPIKRRK